MVTNDTLDILTYFLKKNIDLTKYFVKIVIYHLFVAVNVGWSIFANI